MDLLEKALDALVREDLDGLVASQLLGRASALVRAKNRIEAQLTRIVRRAENTQAAEHDGLTSMRSWLRGHARLSAREAHRLVGNGRALEQLPAMEAAFAAGVVTAEQVTVVAPVTAVKVQAEAVGQGVDLSEVDRALVAVAANQVHAALGKVVQHFLDRLDPDGTEPDPTEGRTVVIARHADGGMTARVELDAVGADKFCTVLESMVQASRPAGDDRLRSQQLGDALVQWADNTLATGQLPTLRTVKPHVIVTIPLADLVHRANLPGAASTGFGTAISAARARMLACDGNVTRIVMGPEGQPLEEGRTKRVFPPHLRRAIEARDHHCVFAGCDAPSYWCDVHHVIHWAHDGETDVGNGVLLCERHHTKVHHGFSVQRDPDGRWHTHRPDGTEILLADPLLLSG